MVQTTIAFELVAEGASATGAGIRRELLYFIIKKKNNSENDMPDINHE